MRDIGKGIRVFEAAPVSGPWRPLGSPEEVIELMDEGSEGVVAVVADAGATFLAPVFEDLAAVVCLSGTPQSHIGIVSREYEVPCLMAAELSEDPEPGTVVEIDCSADPGMVRA